ncbi:MAG: hypothetical protein MN733_22760 [Nitrososphaera sp.]|nr:hypothetical protein [Nitrososphaera sp.]
MGKVHYSSGAFLALKTPAKGNLRRPIAYAGLVLCVLFTVMFSRVITHFGVPSIVNFAHLALAPWLVFLVLISHASGPAMQLFRGVLALLAAIVLSAIANEAGPMNAILEFLILAEPFFFFMAILALPWKLESIRRFRWGLFLIALTHMCLSFLDWKGQGIGDEIKGLFMEQGGGHHVAGAVALTAAVYFLRDNPINSFWVRIATSLGFAMVGIISDSKMVIAAFVAALILAGLFKLNSLVALSKYMFQSAVVLTACYFFVLSFSLLPHFQHKLTQMGIGMEHKWSVVRIITRSYESPINVVVGVGPGHTVSRVATMIPDYYDLLRPMGITTSPVTRVIMVKSVTHSLSNPYTGSSVWALTFTWVSVWGDLGFLGLLIYLFIWLKVWRIACIDDRTRIMFLAAMILASAFTYLEEPGYVIYLVSLLGLAVQQRHLPQYCRFLKQRPLNATAKIRCH